MKSFILKGEAGIVGGRRFEGRWFLILDGVVASSGEYDSCPSLPETFPLFEFPFVTEPLFDAHVHLFLSGSFGKEERSAVDSLPRTLFRCG